MDMTTLYNSKLWFHLYYKHTKAFKEEIKKVREGVLAKKEEMIKNVRGE